MKISVLAMTAAIAISGATSLAADTVNILFTEDTTGVSVAGSGSIDLTGLGSLGTSVESLNFANPVNGAFGSIDGGVAIFLSDVGFQAFGTGGSTDAVSRSGDSFGLAFAGVEPVLVVPEDYTSGGTLDFTLGFDGESFASLGITALPVTNIVGDNDINLRFETISPVPLPAAAPLLLGGLALVGAVGRRRRRS